MKTLGIRLLLIAAVLAPLAAHGQEEAVPSFGSNPGLASALFWRGTFGILQFYVIGGLFAWRRVPVGLLRVAAVFLASSGIGLSIWTRIPATNTTEEAGFYCLIAYFVAAFVFILPRVRTPQWWQRILHFQIFPIAALATHQSGELLAHQLFLTLPFVLLCFRILKPSPEEDGPPAPSASDLGSTTVLFGIGCFFAWAITTSVNPRAEHNDYLSAAGILAFIAAAFTTAARRRVAMSAGLGLIGFLGAIGIYNGILSLTLNSPYITSGELRPLIGATGYWMMGAYFVAAFLAAAAFGKVIKVPRWGQHLLHFVFCPVGLAFAVFHLAEFMPNFSLAIFGGILATVLPFVILCYRLDDWRGPAAKANPPPDDSGAAWR